MKCKWYANFEGVCTNGECPYRGGTCPTSEHPEVCRYAEVTPKPELNAEELATALRICAGSELECDDCPCMHIAESGTNCDDYAKRKAADMLEKLAAEKDAKKPEWIKTEIQRPSEGTDVLMLYKHNIAVGFLRNKNDPLSWLYYIDDVSCTDCDDEPICWMPLPELPKEEER